MILSKNSLSPFIIGTMRLGKWGSNFSTKEYEEFIESCLNLKLIDFDHADIYGDYTTEQEFGQVIKLRPDLRKNLRIITKCGIKMKTANRPEHLVKSYDLSKGHIKKSVETSLKNLHTDFIDLLLLHRPDYLMDPNEIAEAFTELKKEGKVLNFGVSNFTPSQFDLLNSFTPLFTNQIEISLLQRKAFQDGTLDQCTKLGIVPTAWSPLGGGELFKESETESYKKIQQVLSVLGEKYGLSADQVLYAWLRKHPAGIIPVLGTSKIERFKTAIDVLNVTLTHEEWYMLWEAAIGEEIA